MGAVANYHPLYSALHGLQTQVGAGRAFLQNRSKSHRIFATHLYISEIFLQDIYTARIFLPKNGGSAPGLEAADEGARGRWSGRALRLRGAGIPKFSGAAVDKLGLYLEDHGT